MVPSRSFCVKGIEFARHPRGIRVICVRHRRGTREANMRRAREVAALS